MIVRCPLLLTSGDRVICPLSAAGIGVLARTETGRNQNININRLKGIKAFFPGNTILHVVQDERTTQRPFDRVCVLRMTGTA